MRKLALLFLISVFGGLCCTVLHASYLKTIVDATPSSTASICVPADAAQACAILTNKGATNDFEFGDAATDATHGANVQPKGSLTLCTEAAIYCFSTSGTDVGITKIMK
jgi:hypothetical protein